MCVHLRGIHRVEARLASGAKRIYFYAWLAEFKASAEFRKLAPSTVRLYLAYIKLVEDEFGDMPLATLEDRRIRGEFKSCAIGSPTPAQGRLCLDYPRSHFISGRIEKKTTDHSPDALGHETWLRVRIKFSSVANVWNSPFIPSRTK